MRRPLVEPGNCNFRHNLNAIGRKMENVEDRNQTHTFQPYHRCMEGRVLHLVLLLVHLHASRLALCHVLQEGGVPNWCNDLRLGGSGEDGGRDDFHVNATTIINLATMSLPPVSVEQDTVGLQISGSRAKPTPNYCAYVV
ncbi:unnamed protein product, partial [Hydatigera taeniaeformis]|uniref:Uncharacterized protein n=1 Tax=Hydatigena taeniaeformis TaxID=6205 RepID=A0A0R3WUQ6_HYDTA